MRANLLKGIVLVSILGLVVAMRISPAAGEVPNVVGSWRLIDPSAGGQPTFLVAFHPDGTATGTDNAQSNWYGTWSEQADGRITFAFESLSLDQGGQGFEGEIILDSVDATFKMMGGTLQRIEAPSE